MCSAAQPLKTLVLTLGLTATEGDWERERVEAVAAFSCSSSLFSASAVVACLAADLPDAAGDCDSFRVEIPGTVVVLRKCEWFKSSFTVAKILA